MTHTMKTFTAYTNHPEGGLQDVLDVTLKPGFVLISVDDLKNLRMGTGRDEVEYVLRKCQAAMTKRNGEPRNREAQHALGLIDVLLGRVESFYDPFKEGL